MSLSTGGTEFVREVLTVKNVIPQDEAAWIFADEFLTYDECLRKTIRAWLFRVGKLDAIKAAITQQLAEAR
ncbi:hypothetical protein D3C81_1185270 [compost metagenome]